MQYIIYFLISLFFYVSLQGSEAQNKITSGNIETLITQLGNPRFAKRESAQAQLRELVNIEPDMVISNLIRRLAVTDDPEIEIRIKDILREVVTTRFYRKKGFLGISLSQDDTLLKVGEKVFLPINVMQVLPKTAALTNGVLTGDKIIQVDEHVCSTNFGVEEFVKYVSGKGAGAKITLTIWRAGKTETMEITLGERPPLPGEPSIESDMERFFREWLDEHLQSVRKTITPELKNKVKD
jgi:C-terminal processing protease CtpA/Prc